MGIRGRGSEEGEPCRYLSSGGGDWSSGESVCYAVEDDGKRKARCTTCANKQTRKRGTDERGVIANGKRSTQVILAARKRPSKSVQGSFVCRSIEDSYMTSSHI